MLETDEYAILLWLWHGDVKVASQYTFLKTGENCMFTRESLSAARCHSDLFRPTDEEEAEVVQSERSHTRKKSRIELYRCIIGATHTGYCQAIDPGLLFKQGCRKSSRTKLSKLEQNRPRPSDDGDSTFLGIYSWPAISHYLAIDISEALPGIITIAEHHLTSQSAGLIQYDRGNAIQKEKSNFVESA
jgi:hypothetical protein